MGPALWHLAVRAIDALVASMGTTRLGVFANVAPFVVALVQRPWKRGVWSALMDTVRGVVVTLGIWLIVLCWQAVTIVYDDHEFLLNANKRLSAEAASVPGLRRQLSEEQKSMQAEVARLEKLTDALEHKVKARPATASAPSRETMNQLAALLSRAGKLQNQCLSEWEKPAPFEATNKWAQEAVAYLQILNPADAARFNNPPAPQPIQHSHNGAALPVDHENIWGFIETRKNVLSDIVRELKH